MDISDRIVKFRALYDMTQAEFAAICKVTVPTIQAVENRKRSVSKLTEMKIIQVLEKGGC